MENDSSPCWDEANRKLDLEKQNSVRLRSLSVSLIFSDFGFHKNFLFCCIIFLFAGRGLGAIFRKTYHKTFPYQVQRKQEFQNGQKIQNLGGKHQIEIGLQGEPLQIEGF